MTLTQEPQNDLCRNSFWQIRFGIWKLFRHVCDGIRCTNCERAVKNTRQEGYTTTPPCLIRPVFPYERIAGMGFRHRSNNDDSHQTADDD